MSADPVSELRKIHDLLVSFDGPPSIHRANELAGAAEKVAACSVDLPETPETSESTEPDRIQQRLASAARSIKAAEKAARAYRRNPLTRPLSQARFALKVGTAGGWLQGALEKLDPTYEPPPRPGS